MEYKFSNRALSAKPSRIREISARGAVDPEFISFAIGNPASETFPIEDIRKCNDMIYDKAANYALQYGPSIGDAEFRKLLMQRLVEKEGIAAEGNDILITTGSQQGLTIMPMTVTNEGDVVLVEQYTYMGALSCMRGMCAVPYGVKVDETGSIDVAALEEACKTVKNIRYLYLIPNFQNPMGVTMPLEKRKKVYELACKYDFLIYEDNPYGELRYDGEPVPSFKSFDTEGRVVYAGSFSKVLAAGLRLGFLCASNELIAKMTALKGNIDSGSSVQASLIARYYMEQGLLDPHIEETRKLYAKKKNAMVNGLDKYMSSKCSRTNPEGGMFLWVTLPEDADADAVFDAALENHIGVIPSSCFAPDEDKPGKSFRLCFATPTLEQIEIGCKRFGDVTKKFFGE
ncbi:MAG: PLP-dependent aminotransferase family protein [Clostridia bacterium]|nr:PLP-dependent aminotransferase family protein [Clostridia bacterium]